MVLKIVLTNVDTDLTIMDMTGYTKLFNSILASTIWREDDKTRIVWITLLAMADKNGVADGSIPGLADMARVSVDDCEMALNKLMSTDEYSRSKEFQGRRIAEVDGGWQILNHAKYRAKLSADERREYFRVKQAEHRSMSTNVKHVKDMSTPSTHTEAEAKAIKRSTLNAQEPRHEPKTPEAVFLSDVRDVLEAWKRGSSKGELACSGGWWRMAYRSDSGLLERVLAEVRVMVKEGKITESPGQAAVNLWKRWGGKT